MEQLKDREVFEYRRLTQGRLPEDEGQRRVALRLYQLEVRYRVQWALVGFLLLVQVAHRLGWW